MQKACDPSRHLQESPGPPGPNYSQKVSKRVFLGVRQKVTENKIKSNFQTFWALFGLSGVFSETFFSGPPKNTLFETFFANLAPEMAARAARKGASFRWFLLRCILHKEFRGPLDPPPQNSLCRPFPCILKGKEAPT